MRVEDEHAACAVRVSFGWTNVDQDVDRLLDAWGSLCARLGSDAHVRAPAA
jgi:cysteine sulfinate desulfinase/cysteine desulfurase-like protein